MTSLNVWVSDLEKQLAVPKYSFPGTLKCYMYMYGLYDVGSSILFAVTAGTMLRMHRRHGAGICTAQTLCT